ncbi:MAG: chemotaxis protein CheA [bacterium]|nr:MAG: chemotaxis protein CheA [bacterium]
MELTLEQEDTLIELFNIGIGKAASTLNTMVQSHIQMSIPSIKIMSVHQLIHENHNLGNEMLSTVQMDFKGEFSGLAGLIFPTESALKLVDAITGQIPLDSEFDEMKIGTLTEVGNIVLNSIMGSISNVLKSHFTYSIPQYVENTMDKMFKLNASAEQIVLLVEAKFTIEKLKVDGNIYMIFEVGSFENLIQIINQLHKEPS